MPTAALSLATGGTGAKRRRGASRGNTTGLVGAYPARALSAGDLSEGWSSIPERGAFRIRGRGEFRWGGTDDLSAMSSGREGPIQWRPPEEERGRTMEHEEKRREERQASLPVGLRNCFLLSARRRFLLSLRNCFPLSARRRFLRTLSLLFLLFLFQSFDLSVGYVESAFCCRGDVGAAFPARSWTRAGDPATANADVLTEVECLCLAEDLAEGFGERADFRERGLR